jgi:hypothetical protein
MVKQKNSARICCEISNDKKIQEGLFLIAEGDSRARTGSISTIHAESMAFKLTV